MGTSVRVSALPPLPIADAFFAERMAHMGAMDTAASAKLAAALKVGPDRYCLPHHHPHCRPWLREVNGITGHDEHYLSGPN